MGSSVMLAATLRKQLKETGITVEHSAVVDIPSDADLVVTHVSLVGRVHTVVPRTPVISFERFLGDPAVTSLVKAITAGGSVSVG